MADTRRARRAHSIQADEERLSVLIKELEGKDVNEVIAEGSKKLASVPSGGAAPAAAAGGAAAGGAAEEKKEDKPAEKVRLPPPHRHPIPPFPPPRC